MEVLYSLSYTLYIPLLVTAENKFVFYEIRDITL
jgi:hypothetical protein